MPRFKGGYIKIYRSMLESDLDDNPFLFALFTKLLLMATWKETQVNWQGQPRHLPAGSVVFSLKEIADRWMCSRTTVLRWLRYLERGGRIKLETGTRGSLINICNWNLYQFDETNDGTRTEHGLNTDWTRAEHDVALIEEVKKRRREERNNLAPFGDGASGFLNLEEVYQEYPRKRGKSQGMKIAQKQILTQESLSDLKQAIRNYAEECQRENRESKHILYFDSFMRQWRDWIHPENNPADEPFDISKVIERCEKRSRM